jgi:glycerol-3-phosphate dehydrogenase
VLLAAAPHLIRPLRFILPVHSGLRPAWQLRAGLFLYDHIGGRERLPPTRTVRRGHRGEVKLTALQDRFKLGFEYSDCLADDARLVVVNAIDARIRGARIEVGWALESAQRQGLAWEVGLRSLSGERRVVRARALINAAGPWVETVLRRARENRAHWLRLVKGSHIVVRRLYDGAHAYTLQSGDGRIVFTIPYEDDFTLIGTTDVPFTGEPEPIRPAAAEVDYLCRLVSGYFKRSIAPEDVWWSYSGVRPLYDDGEASASTVTRDYVFDLDAPPDAAPLLSVFGGKLTTYRKLAEHALAQLLPKMGVSAAPWTRAAQLPGGDFPQGDLESFVAENLRRYPFASERLIRRMSRAYGTRIERVLPNGRGAAALGEEVAPDVYESELAYLRAQEWARSGEDVLWRRSKLGIHLDGAQRQAVTDWFAR